MEHLIEYLMKHMMENRMEHLMECLMKYTKNENFEFWNNSVQLET